MTQLETVLYTAKTHTTGGRDGASRSNDGRLDIELATSGTAGAGTNPEQLFAAGFAACFENAVIHVTRNKDVKVRDNDITVVGEVGLIANGAGGFNLAVMLDVAINGVEQAKAEEIVQAAHAVCPYSYAIRGNVDVKLIVTAR